MFKKRLQKLVLFVLVLSKFFVRKLSLNRSVDVRHFLIISTGKIGDVVCQTPVFRAIKEKYPDSKITFVGYSLVENVLKNNPRIDHFISLDTSRYALDVLKLKEKFKDMAFSDSIVLMPSYIGSTLPLLLNIPNKILTTFRYEDWFTKSLRFLSDHQLEYRRESLAGRHYLDLLKFIGINNDNFKTETFLLPDDSRAEDFVGNSSGSLVGIVFGAGEKFKKWPLEKWKDLILKLIDLCEITPVLIGSNKEIEESRILNEMTGNRCLNSVGNFNLDELPNLLQKLKLCIGVDTGPIYMADALGILVVDIAGPHNPETQHPVNNYKIVRNNSRACSGIMYADCRPEDIEEWKKISVQEVYNAAASFLN